MKSQQPADTGDSDAMIGMETVTTVTNRRVGVKIGRRMLHEERKQALVAGVMSPDVELPVSQTTLNQFRSPKAFMDAARQYLDPEEVGPVFAKAFTEALASKNIGMLKLMLPYVFGVPEKSEPSSDDGAFAAVLEALTTPRNKGGRRPKQSQLEVIDADTEEGEYTDDQREGSYGEEES